MKPHPKDFCVARPIAARRSRLVPRGKQDRIVRLGFGGRDAWRDLYVLLLNVEWQWFLLGAAVLYLTVNLVFAALYVLQPGAVSSAHPGDFADAFFFSVQTIATIGYGVMAPATRYANSLVTAETLVGMTMLALVTGLIFARFSRPTARVLFSCNMVVVGRQGRPTLAFRMANRRANSIVQAHVTLSVVRDEQTAEGDIMRRFHDLTLVRRETPIFAMTFTVMHEIDEASPIFGATAASLAAEDAEFVATVTGLDETVMQTVHARHSWDATEVLWHRRFADILGFVPDGRRAIDYTRFHDTEPAELPGERT
jgi:inward rectifier potassium channel